MWISAFDSPPAMASSAALVEFLRTLATCRNQKQIQDYVIFGDLSSAIWEDLYKSTNGYIKLLKVPSIPQHSHSYLQFPGVISIHQPRREVYSNIGYLTVTDCSGSAPSQSQQ